ncbi:MAG: glycosyltransferase family 4 protein [Ilumatobacter sp.]|nr:glycosyltransferase family 4 protein [Ilumatobacter sp.]
MTRIVAELVERGHQVHVVTSLPWYRAHAIEPGWQGRRVRREATSWGSITRIDPFAGDDKANLVRRALGFAAFSVLAGWRGLRAGGRLRSVDGVIAMSPPLTLGLTGRLVAWLRGAGLVFNIQDVFPDAAIRTGAISNRLVIVLALALERWSYRAADAVTVLSEDLRVNVVAKLPPRRTDTVHVIPNFVDTDAIRPQDRMTDHRETLGLGDRPVVMYAGNIGFSQSLDLVVFAARALPEVQFVISGEGAAKATLAAEAASLPNLHVGGFVAAEFLPDLLATGDVHVVPLKRGLGNVSVPSKAYSIMAAARPIVAAIDAGTAIPQILAESGGGIAVEPDDHDAFVDALRRMLADPVEAAEMGRLGRRWVEREASPAAVGEAYDQLVRGLVTRADP